MTSAEFKILYSEFAATPDTLVDSTIAEQELLVSDSWGTRRAQVLALSTADALARRPAGRQSRLDVESDKVQTETPYAKALTELKKSHAWLLNRF